MFDVGFWELVLLAGVALLVLGPEKLPKAASTVGRWAGQARTLARGLQTQIRRELEREEQKRSRGTGAPGDEKPANPPHRDDDVT